MFNDFKKRKLSASNETSAYQALSQRYQTSLQSPKSTFMRQSINQGLNRGSVILS